MDITPQPEPICCNNAIIIFCFEGSMQNGSLGYANA